MLSHFVTAARSILARPDPTTGEPSSEHIVQDRQREREGQGPMVTSTRRSNLQSPSAGNVESSPHNSPPAVNGKRKSVSTTPDVTDGQPAKRQKKPATGANGNSAKSNDGSTDALPERSKGGRRVQVMNSVEISERGSEPAQRSQNSTRSTKPIQNKATEHTGNSGLQKKPTHVRFGSEEPAPPPVEDEDEDDTAQQDQDNAGSDQEESDYDEAPEAVSNVAVRKELKDVDRKRDHARQQHEQIKRDKRKEHEKRLQSQAASKARDMSPPPVPQKPMQDEILSESSATLQGSDRRATGPSAIRSLPAFLPDEILNAEPSIRPPTPPRETSEPTTNKQSNKIRFLDTESKSPKDVKVGGTSIRVLDEVSHYNSKTGSNPSLAPKSSKASKNVRDRWITGGRNKDVSSGLRRTTGGPSGFVRK